MQYLAQIDWNQLQGAVGLKQNLNSVGSITSELLKYLFVFAGLTVLLFLIFGGFQMMTSGGDPAGLKEGKDKVTHALIGFVIIFTAYWLVQAIGLIFGVNQIQQIFSK
ncbi:hypothetical protein HY404_02545 [Candidatus Microgenomates bacterium]|nr:hypothetical protein [Candidatus Microgenomates bacterium]